jgi:MtN3 and saliva related transmembrane protein
MSVFPDILGYTGGIILSVQMIPQIFKIIKTKSTKDISTGFLILNVCGLTLMSAYGFIRNDLPLCIPTSLSLFMTSIVLFLQILYLRNIPSETQTITNNKNDV